MVPVFQLRMIRERVLWKRVRARRAEEQALSRRGPERLHSRIWECVRACVHACMRWGRDLQRPLSQAGVFPWLLT